MSSRCSVHICRTVDVVVVVCRMLLAAEVFVVEVGVMLVSCEP